MYHVWTYRKGKTLKVASADSIEDAMHYAHQYTEEGRVTVKDGNGVIAILSYTGAK